MRNSRSEYPKAFGASRVLKTRESGITVKIRSLIAYSLEKIFDFGDVHSVKIVLNILINISIESVSIALT